MSGVPIPVRVIEPLAGDVPLGPAPAPDTQLVDTLGRPLHDLRLSVTDRCNFRCVYCMPKEIFGKDFAFMPRDEMLSFEEMTRLARISVAHGVEKIRLTGGEPLLRKGLEELIAMLAALRTPAGRPVDIALTTNGSALAMKAQALKDAGLKRVTVSLDSLDDTTFRTMNDVNFPVARILAGLDAAHAVGLGPIKINMVVKRGQNDHDIVNMARHFKGTPYILRFIEFMDVGTSNGWDMAAVLPSSEVRDRIHAELPLQEVAPNYTGETSRRWRYVDGEGEIGLISSVTQSFCHTCSRARVSTDGKLFTCLFASGGHDLRALLRDGSSDEQLSAAMGSIWRQRTDRASALRSAQTGAVRSSGTKIEMSYIGG
ncbi:GTP 3',8-cyclase MoaA [Cryobacterium sp. LW097]|uniref:GTP 3',8-cyclase MoaA n=1 Tax=unclassified Cryobacterium TaxID=2649013 RepID=UPI000B4CC8AB|nr:MULTISPECIES: GTP 3',8-cyclase MoaA [unclassified Cryobacterium]ASD23432.1 GTP 3',8-cyclase MoaA [Cryobacterium sp. LW097]TFC53052.1 GTP 3',8-cyclase MoaA [Cryobacterium sp. TMB3-1-2]TFC69468.1 GTP 3',8-cyclase MoaA [Cryobacterium sp. TMB3-15]TFC77523.1 GTP 3',8-cyclase MoaA [Cryobacterium sp. TMB3-10]TFD42788.1 GTP 3',8-cyclase MoaA [Cryobacterium sp. TMB3-12]